jgi:hypothetical protein
MKQENYRNCWTKLRKELLDNDKTEEFTTYDNLIWIKEMGVDCLTQINSTKSTRFYPCYQVPYPVPTNEVDDWL